MIILGIDPGTRATGFGVIEVVNSQIKCLEYGIIRAKQTLPLIERLDIMSNGISEIVESHKPDVASIEKAFVGKNANTALVLGHARGVLMLAAYKSGAIIKEFAPTEIKKAVVGNGRADKSQVEYMVRALLQLGDTEIKDDAFDALGAAICAYNHK